MYIGSFHLSISLSRARALSLYPSLSLSLSLSISLSFARARALSLSHTRLSHPLSPSLPRYTVPSRERRANLIRTRIYDKFSRSMKTTAHLVHISHRKTASGTNWSNRLTYRVFIMNTHRDEIASYCDFSHGLEPLVHGSTGNYFAEM